MKNFTKTFLTAAVILLITVNAGWGQIPFSATYTFGTDGNVQSFTYNGTTYDGITMGTIDKVGITTSSSSGNFRGTNWPTDTSPDIGKYIGFTITAQSGYKFTVETITFGLGRSSTGIRTSQWRGSADSYAALINNYTTLNAGLTNTAGEIGNPDLNSSWTGNVLTLGSSYIDITTSAGFRFYMYAAEASGGTAGLQGPITITGTFTSTGGSAPSVTTTAVSLITSTGATFNGDITSDGGSPITDRGFCYKTSSGVTITDNKTSEGGTTTGTYSKSFTLSPETNYFYKAYATNIIGTTLSSTEINFWTLSTEPSTHTTSFLHSVISQVQIDLSFDAASTITNADGYIILQRIDLAPTGLPTDGNAYSVGNTIDDATVAAIITNTSATSTSITGLTAGTEYYFTILPYNYDGLNDETYNYKTDGTIPVINGTTSAPNDADSFVEDPASQVNLGTISSLIDTDGEALAVFKFKITDVGGDGVQTKVTQVTINAGSNNTADWSNTIQGVKLYEGSSFVTIGTATINESSIVIPITSGNLNIDNSGNAEVSLFIYLNTSGITDNQILQFNIPTTSHGFIADETGSTFLTTFENATTSNQVSIEVDATILKFVQQPSNTNVGVTMSPAVTIETTDENGNRDLDETGTVNLASSGTMTGIPTASLSSGFGTFSGIVHEATGTGLTLTASLSGLTDAVSNTFNIATYTWIATGTASWTIPTNWTPDRTSPSNTDVLLFNSGTTVTVTNVPTQTIAILLVSNSTTVNLQAGTENALNISGGSGTDLSVEAGTQLNINGTSALIISLSTGATGSISGSMTFSNEAHKLYTADPSGITFNDGSTFTAGTGFTGNAFGNTSYNSIIFASGSIYIHTAGGNPFGADQPKSVVTFQSGSLYKHETSSNPAFSGRTYADFELNISGGTITPTGSFAVVMDNLTVTNGTLNFNVTGTPGHFIKGDITVSSGATLNFEPAESGTINLNGSSAQSISGSGTLTFGANLNLEINNSNGVTLNKDVTIDGTLTLTSGLLSLGDYNLILDESSTIGGTPSSSNMVVATGSGQLRKIFTAIGSFTFPVGDNTGTEEYSPVTLNFTSGSFSSAYAGVNLMNEKNSNNSSTNDYLDRYWTVTQSGISSFSCDVALYYVDTDIHGTEANIYCGSYNGSSWSLLNVSDPDNNKLSGTVTSFSTFTGGEQGALPIELISFTSSISDNSAHLTWSTAAELNNSGFDVERKKTEDNNWQKVGFVEGHGTTNTPQHYAFSDRFLSTGKYNYRLKQIDFNGNYQYYYLSSEVSIGVPKKFELSQNFPNPFNPVTNISYKLPNDSKVSIKIFDILGREVRTLVSEFKTAGYHTINFDGSTLSSGMYFYRIKTNGFEAIRKMLLIK